MKAEEDFVSLMSEMARRNGLGEVASRIVGTLYLEPQEICLEEISKRTGYSMAAVSTDMKLLVDTAMVSRISKPGSRKLYFFMEKDFTKMIKQALEKRCLINIPEAKQRLPLIIEQFRQNAAKSKDAAAKKKLEEIEQYYKTVLKFEKVFERMFREIDEL